MPGKRVVGAVMVEPGAAIRPNTKLGTINSPHNPTGAILSRDRYDALIESADSTAFTSCTTRSSTGSARPAPSTSGCSESIPFRFSDITHVRDGAEITEQTSLLRRNDRVRAE